MGFQDNFSLKCKLIGQSFVLITLLINVSYRVTGVVIPG